MAYHKIIDDMYYHATISKSDFW